MKKVFIFFGCLFIFLPTVYADNINIDCPDSIAENQVFVCEITGDTNMYVSSINAEIILSDDLSLVGFIPSDEWLGNGLEGVIDLYSDNIINNSFNIGYLKLKNNGGENNIISIESIYFYNSNKEESIVDSVTNSILIDDNVDEGTDLDIISSAYLADIKIDNYNINYLRNVYEYDLKINNEDKLNILPILEDNSSSYYIMGNSDLENGSVIRIEVKSEDKLLNQQYLINIIKDNDEIEENRDYSIIFIIIIIILVIFNVVRFILRIRKKQ